jgi:hypothetical protein
MKITPTQFRIGNIVHLVGDTWTEQVREKLHRITAQDLLDMEEGSEGYEAVRITEELLGKAGFETDFSTSDYLDGYNNRKLFILASYNAEGLVCEFENGKKNISVKIQYLHQLQNLHHALTGEELEIDITN